MGETTRGGNGIWGETTRVWGAKRLGLKIEAKRLGGKRLGDKRLVTVLKILQVINSLKYVGITENYRVRKE